MSTTSPILQGLYWFDLDGIRQRQADGAGVDAFDENGNTPLVEAIEGGTGYPDVVKLLLELGANPSLPARSGLTPWQACLMRRHDRVVDKEYRKIRKLLEAAKADRQGDELFDLEDKAIAGDLAGVRALLDSGCPLEAGHAVPLGAALFNGQREVADLLLQRGANVEGYGVEAHGVSLLMSAASSGLPDMVQLLVSHGADVCRSVGDADGHCTAAWYARQAGHNEVADWLAAQHPGAERSPIPKAALNGGAKAKYLDLYRQYTHGVNHGLTTEAIVKKLQRWDKDHGIHVLDVATDRLTVQFERLPEDLGKLTKDIAKFSPDTLASFAAMAEQKTPHPDQRALLQGLDPDDKHFALKALQRWLQTHKTVGLWWD